MTERKESVGRLILRKPARSQTRRLDNELAYQLRRAQEASFSAFARRVGETRIWPGWFALLTIIHDNPHINQTALSQASMRDKSTLTASLRQLVRAGLVNRDRHLNDARSYCLSLTPLGEAHLKELRAHAKAHDRRLDEIVGPENKPVLVAILKNLADELSRS